MPLIFGMGLDLDLSLDSIVGHGRRSRSPGKISFCSNLALWGDVWSHLSDISYDVTKQYGVLTPFGITLCRHVTNFGAKGLANVRRGRYVNTQAFSFKVEILKLQTQHVKQDA